MNKLSHIIAFNLLGMTLIISDYLTGREGLWSKVDTAVFYFFNNLLVKGSVFVDVVAYTNMRIFDVVIFLAMTLLYMRYYLKEDRINRRKMLCMGIVMLLTAILIKQCSRFLPMSHPSPSIFFENVNRLIHLTTLPTKDASSNSFPGDHGMMLMIFAAFMARYHGFKAFLGATLITVVFSMPRIASGAHWFSDIYAGSLSIVCIGLSWLLLTPASDILAAFVGRLIPERVFRALHL